jgi:hypothetical protein
METTATFHELDPDGDIVLVMRIPGPAFAVWDETQDYPSYLHLPESRDDSAPPSPKLGTKRVRKGRKIKQIPCVIWSDVPEPAEPEPAEPEPAEPEPAEPEPAEPGPAEPEPAEPEPPEPEPPEEPAEDDDTEPESIEIRVSSRHVALASTQFKRTLTGAWKEGTTLRSQGFLRMEIAEWDADALLILMNIIHGRTRSVPRLISLEVLAKIAVLVDYYECAEVVEIFSDMWITELKEKMPETYSRDTVLWICISWLFRKPEEFHTATTVALTESGSPIQDLGLPIPPGIIRKGCQYTSMNSIIID